MELIHYNVPLQTFTNSLYHKVTPGKPRKHHFKKVQVASPCAFSHRYRDTAEIQRYRDTAEIQRYRVTEIQRYRITEIQIYRDTEIQQTVIETVSRGFFVNVNLVRILAF